MRFKIKKKKYTCKSSYLRDYESSLMSHSVLRQNKQKNYYYYYQMKCMPNEEAQLYKWFIINHCNLWINFIHTIEWDQSIR